jgi:hypothetical protein
MEAAKFRIAHQLLVRRGLRGQPAGPVLFVEFSVAAEQTEEDGPITAGLQQQIVDALDSEAWDFRVVYQRNRILVLGRVGPFRWPAGSDQPMLPI